MQGFFVPQTFICSEKMFFWLGFWLELEVSFLTCHLAVLVFFLIFSQKCYFLVDEILEL